MGQPTTMLETDLFTPRPTLINPSLLARALGTVGRGAVSKDEVRRRPTETHTVDLDTVAALLPKSEPEPIWLASRG